MVATTSDNGHSKLQFQLDSESLTGEPELRAPRQYSQRRCRRTVRCMRPQHPAYPKQREYETKHHTPVQSDRLLPLHHVCAELQLVRRALLPQLRELELRIVELEPELVVPVRACERQAGWGMVDGGRALLEWEIPNFD